MCNFCVCIAYCVIYCYNVSCLRTSKLGRRETFGLCEKALRKLQKNRLSHHGGHDPSQMDDTWPQPGRGYCGHRTGPGARRRARNPCLGAGRLHPHGARRRARVLRGRTACR